jgi:hypothetical protein
VRDDLVVATGPVDEAARLIAAQRTYYDLRAPDHADVSRPSDRRNRGHMGADQVRRLVREFHVTGDVLELAVDQAVSPGSSHTTRPP